mmetsp:Transcript_3089/g.7441  ORF Transcript_3089/g.7441 Transcript_3089/m.7441 type:complete len:216 (-) Transcript_3089:618-1265(-)
MVRTEALLPGPPPTPGCQAPGWQLSDVQTFRHSHQAAANQRCLAASAAVGRFSSSTVNNWSNKSRSSEDRFATVYKVWELHTKRFSIRWASAASIGASSVSAVDSLSCLAAAFAVIGPSSGFAVNTGPQLVNLASKVLSQSTILLYIIHHSVHPIAHTSAGFPCFSSGPKKGLVPTYPLSGFLVVDNPKSVTKQFPSSVTMRFAGLMSRWMTPLE